MSNGSTRTYHLYDMGELVVEMNGSGQITGVNVFAADGLVARKQSGSWIYYNFDQQGNVAQRTSSTGAVLSSSTYDAYGVESTTGSPTDPFGYNARWGYYLDRSTGLYLCQHRYYDPGQGRWLNRDPAGYEFAINVYSGCLSHPVETCDPTGKGDEPVSGGAGDLPLLKNLPAAAQALAMAALANCLKDLIQGGGCEKAADCAANAIMLLVGPWIAEECTSGGTAVGGVAGGLLDPIGGEVPGAVAGGVIGGIVGLTGWYLAQDLLKDEIADMLCSQTCGGGGNDATDVFAPTHPGAGVITVRGTVYA